MLSLDEDVLLHNQLESTIVVPPSAVPAHLLEERSRRGLDRWDEMWEGLLHIVPVPTHRHQRFGSKLLSILDGPAEAKGLEAIHEAGLVDRFQTDYRIPDLAVYRPERVVDDYMRGAEFVVEIVSPGDKSRDKLPWYAARGVREVLLVDRDTLAVDFFVVRDGAPERVEPARSAVLGCTFERVHDDHFRVVTPEGSPADIRLQFPD